MSIHLSADLLEGLLHSIYCTLRHEDATGMFSKKCTLGMRATCLIADVQAVLDLMASAYGTFQIQVAFVQVHVRVEIPSKLSNDERQIVEELKEIQSKKPVKKKGFSLF